MNEEKLIKRLRNLKYAIDTVIDAIVEPYPYEPTDEEILPLQDKVNDLLNERIENENLTWEHYLRINTILNKHSKPTDEGGIHYKDAYEEMEKYEHELADKHCNSAPNPCGALEVEIKNKDARERTEELAELDKSKEKLNISEQQRRFLIKNRNAYKESTDKYRKALGKAYYEEGCVRKDMIISEALEDE